MVNYFLNKICSYFYFRVIYPFRKNNANIIVKYLFRSKQLKINIKRGFESRNEASMILFLEAFSLIKSEIKKNFTIEFYTGDYPLVNKRCFSFSKSSDDCNVTLIPNFDFAFWKEAGILDYQNLIDKILVKSNLEFEIPKLFWIGNLNTNNSRKLFLEKFKDFDFIECIHFDPAELDSKNKYVSLEDHCTYKYLIDLQGNGYSGRIKYLLFTGRPLFIQERKFKTFYHELLVPFEHFIPVKEDFSDLIEKIKWLEENPDLASKIGANAKSFAINNLQKENVIKYYSKVIIGFINNEI
jgi:hypothetical protein